MFDKEYSFHASHADKVIALTAQFGDTSKTKLFSTNREVYIASPIIGFLYNKNVPIDRSNDKTTKIFLSELSRESKTLWYNYRLLMLLDNTREPVLEKRIDKAFRNYGKPGAAEDEDWYNQYVLGSVDILYEKLIDGVNLSDDYPKRLYDFLEEFEERYNAKIAANEVVELCLSTKNQ